MATEKQNEESKSLGNSAGVGAYNSDKQPVTEQPVANLELLNPPGSVGAAHPDQLKGDALADAFGLGAFNKK